MDRLNIIKMLPNLNVAETLIPEMVPENEAALDPETRAIRSSDFINKNGSKIGTFQRSGPLRRTMAPMYVRTFNIGRGGRFKKRRNLARRKKWIPYNKYMAQKRRYKYGRYTSRRRYRTKRTYRKRGAYTRTYRRRY